MDGAINHWEVHVSDIDLYYCYEKWLPWKLLKYLITSKHRHKSCKHQTEDKWFDFVFITNLLILEVVKGDVVGDIKD